MQRRDIEVIGEVDGSPHSRPFPPDGVGDLLEALGVVEDGEVAEDGAGGPRDQVQHEDIVLQGRYSVRSRDFTTTVSNMLQGTIHFLLSYCVNF